MTEAFKRGFLDQINQMKKAESTPLKEVFGGVPAGMLIPQLHGPANTVGEVTGIFSGYDDASEDAYDNGLVNLIPGYGHYLFNQRRGITTRKMRELAKNLGEKDKHPMANNVAEILAPMLQTGAGAGLGAALAGEGGRLEGAGKGAALAALPTLIGALIGMAKGRRTDREQLDTETKGRAAAKYLVPGLAGHDAMLRIGKSRDYVGKNKKKKTDSDKKDDK